MRMFIGILMAIGIYCILLFLILLFNYRLHGGKLKGMDIDEEK